MPVLWDYDNVGPAVQVKVMTYNLFWWNLFQITKGNGDSASTLIRQAGMPEPYDIMGFQECEDPFLVIGHAGLSNEYEIIKDTSSKSAALCIAVRRGSWAILARGLATVAEDQKYGLRQAQWVRLRHMASGKTVFFVNHHGPLPMNSGGICGGYATAHRLLHVVAANGRPGDAIVLLGDFNAGDTSQTIQFVEQHLHRVFHGTTLDGADNVFSNVAQASAQNLGSGGSDHDALSVVLHLGGASPAPRPQPAMPLLPELGLRPVQPPGLDGLTSAIDKLRDLKDDFLRQ
jgi:endonuclease/exonuclease/phosphatase family metal-dependent hydrolase